PSSTSGRSVARFRSDQRLARSRRPSQRTTQNQCARIASPSPSQYDYSDRRTAAVRIDAEECTRIAKQRLSTLPGQWPEDKRTAPSNLAASTLICCEVSFSASRWKCVRRGTCGRWRRKGEPGRGGGLP